MDSKVDIKEFFAKSDNKAVPLSRPLSNPQLEAACRMFGDDIAEECASLNPAQKELADSLTKAVNRKLSPTPAQIKNQLDLLNSELIEMTKRIQSLEIADSENFRKMWGVSR